jgi:hypothetical protein
LIGDLSPIGLNVTRAISLIDNSSLQTMGENKLA